MTQKAVKPGRSPKPHARFRVGVAMGFLVAGGVGGLAAGFWYFVLALNVQSSLAFSPLSGFATVAAYQTFQDQGLPLPGIVMWTEAAGPPCFIAGAVAPDLARSARCRLAMEAAASPVPLPCSTWKREVCNVVALSADVHRSVAFQSIFQGYVEAPCRFVRDYLRLHAGIGNAGSAMERARYYARIINTDFHCSALEEDPPNARSASDLWPRLRTHLLLENAFGRSGAVMEMRIRRPVMSQHGEKPGGA